MYIYYIKYMKMHEYFLRIKCMFSWEWSTYIPFGKELSILSSVISKQYKGNSHQKVLDTSKACSQELWWDKEVPREFKNASYVYLFLLAFLSRSIVSFNCSEIQAVLYNQPLTWHLLLYCISDKCVVTAFYSQRRKFSLALFPKVMLCVCTLALTHSPSAFQEVGTSAFLH